LANRKWYTDDAYQYVAAERYDVEIVSFDNDFDGTERGG
jgi:predicted nucleic acid-binding protein